MNTFIVGAVAILALWVIVSIKSQKKANRAFNAFDEAEPWMIRNNIIPVSVSFASYVDKKLLINAGATILVGTGKNTLDQDIGFVIEVLPHQGVVEEEILIPYGIATWHKNASIQAKTLGISLIDTLRSMANKKQEENRIIKLQDAKRWAEIAGNISGLLGSLITDQPKALVAPYARIVLSENLKPLFTCIKFKEDTPLHPGDVAFYLLNEDKARLDHWIKEAQNSYSLLISMSATDDFAKFISLTMRDRFF